ncbi:MAG: hypothetical protein Q8Q78_14330 [Hydrogenophaga sp.]|nr:hypothetical protein [Hydrogenophaga sp.]
MKTPDIISRRGFTASAIGTAIALPSVGNLMAATPGLDSKSVTEGVSFIVYLPTRPEQRERLRGMVFDIFQAMSSEPDFVHAWIHEDLADPHMVINYETWACTREFFLENHLKRPYRQAFESAIPTLLSAERRLVFLKTIRSYPARTQSQSMKTG